MFYMTMFMKRSIFESNQQNVGLHTQLYWTQRLKGTRDFEPSQSRLSPKLDWVQSMQQTQKGSRFFFLAQASSSKSK